MGRLFGSKKQCQNFSTNILNLIILKMCTNFPPNPTKYSVLIIWYMWGSECTPNSAYAYGFFLVNPSAFLLSWFQLLSAIFIPFWLFFSFIDLSITIYKQKFSFQKIIVMLWECYFVILSLLTQSFLSYLRQNHVKYIVLCLYLLTYSLFIKGSI